eukprot:TRINITY_DN4235_c0_g1_i1.p1 TRINITY_DN4235_c0_g1~~TRINITY_DN4235_c0_g1_i1.p1  ORF type:complete len:446 (-),score=58.68 TRINITY_DN4235_c0_g1_i1:66-1403(-)
MTFPLNYHPGIWSSGVSTMAAHDWPRVRVYGVDENILDTNWSEELMVDNMVGGHFNLTDKGAPNIVERMYQEERDAGGYFHHVDSSKIPPWTLSSSIFFNDTDVIDKSNFTSIFNRTTQNLNRLLFSPLVMYQNMTPFYEKTIYTIVSSSLYEHDIYKPGEQFMIDTPYVCPQGHYAFARQPLTPLAFVSQFPGTSFRKKPLTDWGQRQPLLLTMQTYSYFENLIEAQQFNTTQTYGLFPNVTVPDAKPMIANRTTPWKNVLFIKFKRHASDSEREFIKRTMKALPILHNNRFVEVIDLDENLRTIDEASEMLNAAVSILVGIMMFLAFFVLLLSLSAIVYENFHEIGVLRAIGFTAAQIVTMYMMEALAVVFASLALSLPIGIGISAALTLQDEVFQVMQSTIFFPTDTFIVLSVVCAIIAIVATYIPTRRVKRTLIANLLSVS